MYLFIYGNGNDVRERLIVELFEIRYLVGKSCFCFRSNEFLLAELRMSPFKYLYSGVNIFLL